MCVVWGCYLQPRLQIRAKHNVWPQSRHRSPNLSDCAIRSFSLLHPCRCKMIYCTHCARVCVCVCGWGGFRGHVCLGCRGRSRARRGIILQPKDLSDSPQQSVDFSSSNVKSSKREFFLSYNPQTPHGHIARHLFTVVSSLSSSPKKVHSRGRKDPEMIIDQWLLHEWHHGCRSGCWVALEILGAAAVACCPGILARSSKSKMEKQQRDAWV